MDRENRDQELDLGYDEPEQDTYDTESFGESLDDTSTTDTTETDFNETIDTTDAPEKTDTGADDRQTDDFGERIRTKIEEMREDYDDGSF